MQPEQVKAAEGGGELKLAGFSFGGKQEGGELLKAREAGPQDSRLCLPLGSSSSNCYEIAGRQVHQSFRGSRFKLLIFPQL